MRQTNDTLPFNHGWIFFRAWFRAIFVRFLAILVSRTRSLFVREMGEGVGRYCNCTYYYVVVCTMLFSNDDKGGYLICWAVIGRLSSRRTEMTSPLGTDLSDHRKEGAVHPSLESHGRAGEESLRSGMAGPRGSQFPAHGSPRHRKLGEGGRRRFALLLSTFLVVKREQLRT